MSLYSLCNAAPAATKGIPAPQVKAPKNVVSPQSKVAPEAWPAQDPTVRTTMYIRILGLTPDQVKKLQTYTAKHNAEYAKIGKSKSDLTTRLKLIRELRQAYQKSLIALLTPAQKERFNKVSPMEVRIEALREQLGLTSQQADGLAKLMQEAGASVKSLQLDESKGKITAEQRTKGFADAKKKLDDGVKALLTPAQIQKMNKGFAKR